MAEKSNIVRGLLWEGCRAIEWTCPLTWGLLLITFPVGFFLAGYTFGLLGLVAWGLPWIFSPWLVDAIKSDGRLPVALVATGLYFVGMLATLGIAPLKRRRRIERGLLHLGLKSGDGTRPKLVSMESVEGGKTRLKVYSPGVGAGSYAARMENMEAAFGSVVESVKRGKAPEYVEIVLTLRNIPKRCDYREMAARADKPSSFVIGEGMAGTLTKSIADIPGGHLLIAGTTGGGKSNWFKATLLSLLNSSPCAEFFLLDFKGGVEFAPFGKFPNVTVEKSMEGGLRRLRQVRQEMDARFALLEGKGKSSIEPARHGRNHLFVAVDEASILYGKVSRSDPNHAMVAEARQITNDIAKRGRAAAISLVLATQKITKETIDTSIQENITGRMCFRMNTLPGSLVVMGDKSAFELPDIPGRALWQCGNERSEVQAPLLNEKDIERAAEVAYHESHKFHPLLGSNHNGKGPPVYVSEKKGEYGE